jgi:hypothetical protein
LNPELDNGTSDFNVRNRFTFASVWELPFGRGKRFGSGISRPADWVVGGWQLNSDITIQSGPPFSILADGKRADIVSGSGPCPAGGTADAFGGMFFCPPNTPVFANDPAGPKFGNSGRNIFRGERQEYVNASLFKNLMFNEGFTAQIRIQAYNVFNHVNRFRPENNINSANFGNDTAEQRRRQLEFGLRLIF